MRTAIVALSVALLAWMQPCRADSIAALDLFRMCQGRDTESVDAGVQIAICGMYLAGLNDMQPVMVAVAKVSPLYCLPKDGVETEQLIRVFVKSAEDHPEMLHLPARTVAILGFQEAFPCAKSP